MSEKDLSELYTYLELFQRTFITCEEEITSVLLTIKKLYSLYTGLDKDELIIKALRNPRDAGRKQKYTEKYFQVRKLSSEGKSVRAISEIMDIPKSTVQRILQSETSHF